MEDNFAEAELFIIKKDWGLPQVRDIESVGPGRIIYTKKAPFKKQRSGEFSMYIFNSAEVIFGEGRRNYNNRVENCQMKLD